MLANVIKALADLKEKDGSTVRNITERLRCYIKENKAEKNSFASQVRSALRHGIQTGIILHQGRRYKLDIPEKVNEVTIKKSQELSRCREESFETSASDLAKFMSEMNTHTDQKYNSNSNDSKHRSRKQPGRRCKTVRANQGHTDEDSGKYIHLPDYITTALTVISGYRLYIWSAEHR